jgi:hypothetical protein
MVGPRCSAGLLLLVRTPTVWRKGPGDATFKNIFIYTLTSFLFKRFINAILRYEFLRRCLLNPRKSRRCGLGIGTPRALVRTTA